MKKQKIKGRVENEMKEFTIETLLDKIVGSTQPYGESEHDSKALDRLDYVDEVLEWVTDRLYECRRSKNNYQGSMVALAKKAREIADCYIETFKDLAEPSELEIEREEMK